jgi:hypothetical protein
MRSTINQDGAPLGVEPDDLHDDYDRAGLAALSDAQLFDRAAAVVATPKQAPASSFVLHTPLELMARRLLLPFVPPEHRRAARQRIVWVAAQYERAGDPAPLVPVRRAASVPAARAALLAALDAGDVEGVDAAAISLMHDATADEVLALAAPTVDRLGAAGHAPIGFFLAGRTMPVSRSAIHLLRPLLHELAREPKLRVRWVDEAAAPSGDGSTLTAALAGTPRLGLPGSNFIFPIVHQVDAGGLARERLDRTRPADGTAAATATLRVAAHSMLQDDADVAPYGWTHCLTLPHAIFELLPWLPDPHRAAAVAATYVVGFRAAEGAHPIDPHWVPEPTAVPLVPALDAEPGVAAASWYHAGDEAVAVALPQLIGRVAAHEDAHLVKYTLACLAAAERDPAQRALYRAATAYLVAWWAAHPATAFTS